MEKNNFTTKLHEVCGSDPLRPLNSCVHFEGGFAYASDGHMTIMQSLEYHSVISPENLAGHSIHKDSYKKIMTYQMASATIEGIECIGEDGEEAFFAYFNRNGQQPPDIEKIISGFEPKGVDFIGFNPELLKDMIAAMYTNPDKVVRVTFSGIDKCMFVDVPGINNQKAIVMPAIVQASLF